METDSTRPRFSERERLAAQSGLFGALAALSVFLAIDIMRRSPGLLQPDVTIGLLLAVIALGAAVFLIVVGGSYLIFSAAVIVSVPLVVYVREFLLYGPAGIESAVTDGLIVFILGALLIGGAVATGITRLTS